MNQAKKCSVSVNRSMLAVVAFSLGLAGCGGGGGGAVVDVSGLNDTGATQCSDGNFALQACPQASHPGQDAQLGRDSKSLTNDAADGAVGFSFTKVDSAGNTLAHNAATWSCVRDNVTGLLWDATASQEVSYTWALAKAQATGFGSKCGVSGWRLPTPQELANLVDNSVARSATSTPVIDQKFFPDQKKAVYWSARDADATGSSTAVWGGDFEYGMLTVQSETASNRVRLVNGTAKTPNYQIPVAGTIKDTATDLQWQQCADGLSGSGCAVGTAQSYTWQAALNRVAAVNLAMFAGFRDWRLPNRNELASILDHSKNNPALDVAAFVGFPQVGGVTPTFWTSTPYAADGTKAWSVGFKDGEVAFTDTTNSRLILLVRGGR